MIYIKANMNKYCFRIIFGTDISKLNPTYSKKKVNQILNSCYILFQETHQKNFLIH
ncbi:unnamed protein product (macronuclear) [Paramecium tetraurelia]|uniref:Uncharacterized protein n=1 Tax=Paramecium tetraurelia TaxID=5888 RepID=A0DBU4_PARTE|nr:uncharacterized protein GSPATT00015388001 [Paramecium tetraurelia]CAK80511.1 unnamed protein product [Paramecium tetraurelia]|eukprot:XP_001447908.1 hypothetical protein (macronuclear) [Paramecium tetraurelia strain d4-2]